MAETFTVDTSPQTETLGESLTSDEQESLALGEKMQAQQEELLAGKYKNAEELERAYVELQSKFGEKSNKDSETTGDAESSDTEAKTEETEEASEETPAIALLNEANKEYYDNDNSLSPETIEKFQSMSSTDLVNAYLESIKGQSQTPQSVDLTQADINVVQNTAGGEAEYGKLVNWASENLPANDIEAFDELVSSGNVGAIKLAVSGLKAQYENLNGYEGRMLSGKPPKSSGDVFRSQAELVEAMSDARYDKDPAYRQDVIEKLDRSDMQF
tara:strand:- start:8 stop:823 length:816 start_codon:yes stop_codon:yes gene_type:complete